MTVLEEAQQIFNASGIEAVYWAGFQAKLNRLLLEDALDHPQDYWVEFEVDAEFLANIDTEVVRALGEHLDLEDIEGRTEVIRATHERLWGPACAEHGTDWRTVTHGRSYGTVRAVKLILVEENV